MTSELTPVATHRNVVCPGCACVCDDVQLTIQSGTDSAGAKLVDFQPNCDRGADWFRMNLESEDAFCRHRGATSSYDDAIAAAAEILDGSDAPLIYGLSRSATAAQRVAVELTERLGGVIDSTASLCHGPSIMAIQEVGEVTSSMGEIRHRADLVIFWGCSPADSHPRHSERYSVQPKGQFIPEGRAGRKIVMVGDEALVNAASIDDAGTEPDLTILLPTGGDLDALRYLQTALEGRPLPNTPEPLLQLIDLMKDCNYGVIFFGLELAETRMAVGRPGSGIGHLNVTALLQLVAKLNEVTRFAARRMRLQGDVSGADNVLSWQSGYPFAVDYSREYPRYSPGEYSASDLLERGDVDACLLIGAETANCFSTVAKRHLESIPTIVLDYSAAHQCFEPTVFLPSAVYGLHTEGVIYRMDNVPLVARKMTKSSLPNDEQILKRILEACHFDSAACHCHA
ncbi:MAG: formylmethanofuran dehydrogenase subunit B [Fuerstiella sp.]